MKIQLLLICFFLFTLLSSTFANQNKQINTKVQVIHSSSSTWLIRYKTSEPVQGLKFKRSYNDFRSEKWKAKTKGIFLTRFSDQDILHHKDGLKFDEVEIIMQTDTSHLPKDYEMFQTFGDGSQLIFSGHLLVEVMSANSKNQKISNDLTVNKKAQNHHTFEFVPLKKEKVVAGNFVSNATPLIWSGKPDNQIYIYFGNSNFFENEFMTGIIDQTLPSWIKKSIYQNLPKILSTLTQKFDTNLGFKPTIYFSYNSPNKDFKNSGGGGGVSGQIVNFNLEGRSWQKQNSSNAFQLFKLLAHESVHLWNGTLFHNSNGSDDYWMSEGSADAFSYLLAQEFGIVADQKLSEIYQQNLNKCLIEIHQKPLLDKTLSASKAPYNCGATLSLLTDLALKKVNKENLFMFWKDLFKKVRNKKSYSIQNYFDLLQSKLNQKDFIDDLKKILNVKLEDTTSHFQILFSKTGIKTAETNSFSNTIKRSFMRELLVDFMKTDCNGYVSMGFSENSATFESIKPCQTLKQTLEVDQIEDTPFFTFPIKAYEKIQKSCQNKNHIVFSNSQSQKTLSLLCPNPIKPLPKLLKFENFL